MDVLLIIGLIIVILFLGKLLIASIRSKRKVFKNGVYQYTPKESLMTRAEGEFFWKLNNVAGDRYFVFPQVHLSALLDHHVKGQDWKYAFRHINGKSVDYVLCSKTTLQPMYAVELDDESHSRPDRVERDTEVERIFDEANVPLVRFRDYKELTEGEIANAFANARKLANSRA